MTSINSIKLPYDMIIIKSDGNWSLTEMKKWLDENAGKQYEDWVLAYSIDTRNREHLYLAFRDEGTAIMFRIKYGSH